MVSKCGILDLYPKVNWYVLSGAMCILYINNSMLFDREMQENAYVSGFCNSDLLCQGHG